MWSGVQYGQPYDQFSRSKLAADLLNVPDKRDWRTGIHHGRKAGYAGHLGRRSSTSRMTWMSAEGVQGIERVAIALRDGWRPYKFARPLRPD